MVSSIYDNADIYELAFADRNFDVEATFILSALSLYSKSQMPPAVLDIASGPGQHAAALVKFGCRVTLLDQSPAMLDRARQRLNEFAHQVEFCHADMRQFSLPGRFDLAICMLDSLAHVVEREHLISHFRSVASVLKEEGIYIIELAVPDADNETPTTEDTWTVEQQENRVTVKWGVNRKWIDRDHGICRIPVEITCETKNGIRSISETMIMREWTREEIDLSLQAVPELHRLQTYGAFDLSRQYDTAAWRLIILMEKRSPQYPSRAPA